MVGEGCQAGRNWCQAAGKMVGELQESEERAARGEVARVCQANADLGLT